MDSNTPAAKKRLHPTQMGGQEATKYLVPVLLAPHKIMTNTRLLMMVLFDCLADTLGVCHKIPRLTMMGRNDRF